MYSSREKGDMGEDAAVDYLIKSGYMILDRNFQTRYGEIDVIAVSGDYIVFIEVKARRDFKMGFPSEAVNLNKQRRIIKMALTYISMKKLYSQNFRFDVVEVVINKNKVKYLQLIKDAFQMD